MALENIYKEQSITLKIGTALDVGVTVCGNSARMMTFIASKHSG